MTNDRDNALEAVRSAVVNATELGLTKPQITEAVARGLHTDIRPRNAQQAFAGRRLSNVAPAGHYSFSDDEL